MNGLTITGLGPGPAEHITPSAIDIFKKANTCFLQTDRHGASALLKREDVAFSTMDPLYAASEDFDQLNAAIAQSLAGALEGGSVAYGVPGGGEINPGLRQALKERGIAYHTIPGLSFASAALALTGSRLAHGYICMNAVDVRTAPLESNKLAVINEVDDRMLAGEVKLRLLDYYHAEHIIHFITFYETGSRKIEIALEEMDRQAEYGNGTTLVIPEVNLVEKTRFTFSDLVEVMDILRSPGGCPWDREQTHESLKQYLIEECYETLDAIDKKDDEMLWGELGDVMLQVVFHAKIANEQHRFNINDVTSAICRKMIDRHTHIFGTEKAETASDVLRNWDRIKKAEKKLSSHSEAMKDVAAALPALMRSAKVQHKAAQAGFDWDKPEDALEKVREETGEIEAELKVRKEGGSNRAQIASEIGDLLFASVNVARMLKVEPEQALYATIEKFISRFEYMEQKAGSLGRKLDGMSLPEMDALWEEAKQKEKNT